MPRGGYRPGAGRPKGSRSFKAGRQEEPAPARDLSERSGQPQHQSPLDYMLGVMNDQTADDATRDRMAIAAAPYVHGRAGGGPGKKEGKADRATQAGKTGRFATPPTPARLVV